jgi:hypothetical protein
MLAKLSGVPALAGALFILCYPPPLYGDWADRPQAGLGFTNNANYEDSDTDSDFYLFLRNSLTHLGPGAETNLWLSYKAYFEEKHNSVFNWRLGRTWPKPTRSFGILDLDVAAGGQHYSGTAPGRTEESFDNIYAEVAASRTKILKPRTELRLEPGYQLKYFTDLHGRADHTLYFLGSLDWAISARSRLSPYGEFGLVFSNDSLFRRNYLEFGVGYTQPLRRDIDLNLSFMSRFSTFPNRTVSQETIVSRRRGQAKTASLEENETHTLVQLKGSLVKMVNNLELTGSLILNNQKSKSGFEDYSELGILGSVTLMF